MKEKREMKKEERKKRKLSKRKLKVEIPQQEIEVRIKNFNEVPFGYSEEQAIEEAKRCLQCKKPKCIEGCPVDVDIPAFIKLIEDGKFDKAAKKIKEKNSLPAVCGRVCPQEDQCEKMCVLGRKKEFEPVAIGGLERFAADWEAEYGTVEVPEIPPSTGKKVAVVGSGPAGLTCASDLVRMGHQITLFESLHKSGGVLVYGIPEFRLPKKIVQREVDYIKSLGVDLRVNSLIGKLYTINELKGKYDAIFLGTGAGLPMFLGIPGENYNGVYSANEFLTRSNLMKAYLFPEWDTPIKRGEKVAVVGGGNVAMDSARTALRLGADEVYLVYRRSEKEMPARIEEIERAKEEGIKFMILSNPIEVIGKNGWVKALKCIKMKLGEPDESGRRKPIPIQGSEFVFNIDLFIVAIGTRPNPLIPQSTPDLKTTKWGTIVVKEDVPMTSIDGVFAGGDIVTGAATVILAMGAGKEAAKAIDEYIKKIKF